MPHATPLPIDLAGVPFTVRQAADHGVRPTRLRARDLHRPYHGVRTVADPAASPLLLAQCYAARMSPGEFFSHTTAALLHGLPLPLRLQRNPLLHVSIALPSRGPNVRGIRNHRVAPGTVHLSRLHGHALSCPVDTWCAMATLLSLDELVAVGDALVRRQSPLATVDELKEAVHLMARRRGARLLREASALVRPGVDSPKETELRLLVVRAGLPEPEVNARLFNRYGAFMAFGDLAYREYRVLLEYDGGQHRDNEAQFNRDIDRLDEVMEGHWRVIRVNKSHLRHPATLIARIRTALLTAGWRP